MASTIAAITTGIGGIVQTADASGNLSLLSGDTTVVAITATGATVTGTLSASDAVSGTTGTFTGAVSGTTGTFTGAVSGTTGTFTGATVTGALTTTGNTILGDASTDTLNVGNGGLVKDASGNVGIGTASPTQKLDVTGNATVSGTVTSGTVTSTNLVTNGVRVHNGMYEGVIRWSNDSPNAKTYKIAKFSSAYWGNGAYTIEVWKTYYDAFGYAKYIISGHTFTAYGPAMSLVLVSSTGTITPVSLSGIIAIDSQGGYVNLIVTNPSYGQGKIKITSPVNTIQTTNANISHNECYIYPENTVN